MYRGHDSTRSNVCGYLAIGCVPRALFPFEGTRSGHRRALDRALKRLVVAVENPMSCVLFFFLFFFFFKEFPIFMSSYSKCRCPLIFVFSAKFISLHAQDLPQQRRSASAEGNRPVLTLLMMHLARTRERLCLLCDTPRGKISENWQIFLRRVLIYILVYLRKSVFSRFKPSIDHSNRANVNSVFKYRELRFNVNMLLAPAPKKYLSIFRYFRPRTYTRVRTRFSTEITIRGEK